MTVLYRFTQATSTLHFLRKIPQQQLMSHKVKQVVWLPQPVIRHLANGSWWGFEMFVSDGSIFLLWKLWQVFFLFSQLVLILTCVPHQLCHFKLRHLFRERLRRRWECVLWLHSEHPKALFVRLDNTEI